MHWAEIGMWGEVLSCVVGFIFVYILCAVLYCFHSKNVKTQQSSAPINKNYIIATNANKA